LNNYLKISSKLYYMRVFLERGQTSAFERKMYLNFLNLEDELKIAQCSNCNGYDFIEDFNEVKDSHGNIDMICDICMRIHRR